MKEEIKQQVRLVIKPEFNRKSFEKFAYKADWDLLDVFPKTKDCSFEKHYLSENDQEILYIEDEFTGCNFLMLIGDDLNDLIKQARKIPHYTIDDIHKKLAHQKNPKTTSFLGKFINKPKKQNTPRAICFLAALMAPHKFDQPYFDFFVSNFSTNPTSKRDSYIAISYIGWEEFIPYLEELSKSSELSIKDKLAAINLTAYL